MFRKAIECTIQKYLNEWKICLVFPILKWFKNQLLLILFQYVYFNKEILIKKYRVKNVFWFER